MKLEENKSLSLKTAAEKAGKLFSQGQFKDARTALTPFFQDIPSNTRGKLDIYWQAAALYIVCKESRDTKDQRLQKYKELRKNKNRILLELPDGQSTQNSYSATPSNLAGLPGGASAGGVDKRARSVLSHGPSW